MEVVVNLGDSRSLWQRNKLLRTLVSCCTYSFSIAHVISLSPRTLLGWPDRGIFGEAAKRPGGTEAEANGTTCQHVIAFQGQASWASKWESQVLVPALHSPIRRARPLEKANTRCVCVYICVRVRYWVTSCDFKCWMAIRPYLPCLLTVLIVQMVRLVMSYPFVWLRRP